MKKIFFPFLAFLFLFVGIQAQVWAKAYTGEVLEHSPKTKQIDFKYHDKLTRKNERTYVFYYANTKWKDLTANDLKPGLEVTIDMKKDYQERMVASMITKAKKKAGSGGALAGMF